MTPNATHISCMVDFKSILKKYGNRLTPQEMLALASQLVGNLIALQDQTKMTPDMALFVVEQNISIGNQAAMAELMSVPTTVKN